MSDTESDNGAIGGNGGGYDNRQQHHYNRATENLLVVVAWILDLTSLCWYY
jgi:hypothetical protein